MTAPHPVRYAVEAVALAAWVADCKSVFIHVEDALEACDREDWARVRDRLLGAMSAAASGPRCGFVEVALRAAEAAARLQSEASAGSRFDNRVEDLADGAALYAVEQAKQTAREHDVPRVNPCERDAERATRSALAVRIGRSRNDPGLNEADKYKWDVLVIPRSYAECIVVGCGFLHPCRHGRTMWMCHRGNHPERLWICPAHARTLMSSLSDTFDREGY